MSVRVTRDVTSVTVNGTLTNLGDGVVYYKSSQGVSASSNDGSLASGASAALDGVQWLTSDTQAYVNVAASLASGASGSSVPLKLGRPDPDYTLDDLIRETHDRSAAKYREVRAPTGAAISLRFDDSYSQDFTVGPFECNKRNLPYGLGTIRSNLDQAGRLTTAQLTTLRDNGGEVMLHEDGVLADMAAAEGKTSVEWYRDHLLLGDLPALQALGFKPDSFVQPGSWTGNDYIDTPGKARAFDAWTRAYLAASNAYVTDDVVAGSSVKSIPAQRRYWRAYKGVDQDTLANNKALVDQLVQYGGTLDFVAHSWRIGTATFLSLVDFQALLDYIVTQRDAGKLDVLTPTGLAYAQRGPNVNLIRNAGFEEYPQAALAATSPAIWQINGTPTIVAGGRTGSNALQADPSNYAFQYIGDALGLGTVEVTAYAKLVSGAATGARMVLRTQGSGGTQIQNRDVSGTKTDADGLPNINTSTWTLVRKVFTPDAASRQMRVSLYANAGSVVLWDDVQVRKV